MNMSIINPSCDAALCQVGIDFFIALNSTDVNGTLAGFQSQLAPTPDPCAYQAVDVYNQQYHIGALFIILAASLLGTGIPLIGSHYPYFRREPYLFIFCKHIGSGVIIALAFIHLLAPAFGELGNSCNPTPFLKYQYAPLFAMLAVLAMHFIESMVREKHEQLAGEDVVLEACVLCH